MKGVLNFLPSTGGVSWPINQEVGWAKASFHVDFANEPFTVLLSVDGIEVASKDVSAGQDVVMEGRISPVLATTIGVGLYPVAGAISNVVIEYSDAAQAPAGGGLGGIFDWIKANPILAGAVAVGVYLVVKGK